jgi:hypothetical protein
MWNTVSTLTSIGHAAALYDPPRVGVEYPSSES